MLRVKIKNHYLSKIRGIFISFLIFCLSLKKLKLPYVSLIIQGRGAVTFDIHLNFFSFTHILTLRFSATGWHETGQSQNL